MAEELRGGGFELAAIETSLWAVDLLEWQPSFPVCVMFANEVGTGGQTGRTPSFKKTKFAKMVNVASVPYFTRPMLPGLVA